MSMGSQTGIHQDSFPGAGVIQGYTLLSNKWCSGLLLAQSDHHG